MVKNEPRSMMVRENGRLAIDHVHGRVSPFTIDEMDMIHDA